MLFVVKIRYLQSNQTDLLLDTNQRRQLPMTIAIILGTRPEIIKMAPVIRECQRRGLDHSVIPTGLLCSRQMDYSEVVCGLRSLSAMVKMAGWL